MRTMITLALLLLPSAALAQDTCDVQRRLKQLGYFDANVTCTIGPITISAIEKFQRDHGLHIDGQVGEDTAKVLFADRERKSPRPEDRDRRAMSDQEEFARCGDELIEQSVERLGKGRALTGARKAWEARVYNSEGLGIRYGDWANATDKSEECFPASAGARFTWNCTVKARPCKSGN